MDNKKRTQDKLSFTAALRQNVIKKQNYLIIID